MYSYYIVSTMFKIMEAVTVIYDNFFSGNYQNLIK